MTQWYTYSTMPELPEVETIRRGLEKYISHRTISTIEVRTPSIFSGDGRLCHGATITSVRRFGKGLVIDLDNNISIVAHVKMTGQFIYRGGEVSKDVVVSKRKTGDVVPGKHTHIIFVLKPTKNGQHPDFLYYNDIRKFGWVKVLSTPEVEELSFFKSLGPEPLKDLTPTYFRDNLKQSHRPVKNFLMDQKKIAGVGNIYANDALYLAKINPNRIGSSLTEDESTRLLHSVEAVLAKGLAAGGASERNYVNALGESGTYQQFFKVYGRDGKPCMECGAVIQKTTLGGRGTFYCPKCQR